MLRRSRARAWLELAACQEEAGDTPSHEQIKEMAELLAEIEWVIAQGMQKPKSKREDKAITKPCYFNTGCCSFRDGDVTGLELASGEIRLVRWPDNEKKPRRKILDWALLKDVLDKC